MTVEIKVSYFNRGIGQKIIGKGSVVKAGKQFFFCEGEVYAINNGEEILMAKATSTMAVIHKK
jgi:acyl-coenzyme A thioesterase PaaI-like protein